MPNDLDKSLSINPTLENFAQIKGFSETAEGTALLNLSRERDNTLKNNNQILMDRASLTPYEFQQKYGNEVTDTVDQLDVNADSLRKFSLNNRNEGQIASDAIRNSIIGLNSSLAGIGILGATTLNKNLAVGASTLLKEYKNWAQSKQTSDQQNSRTLDGMRTVLDQIDNETQYNIDKENDGSVIASLKSFGRDAASGVVRMMEDPLALQSGLAEGVGSTFAAGPIAKGLGVLGQALTKSALGVTAPAASTVPLSIGLMEGGGTYAGTIQDVISKSHEDLLESSPEYASKILQGIDPETAKRDIAVKAATLAAVIQGPIAGVTGKLVSKFESAPLSRNSIKDAVKNVASETVEESAQSFSGEVAQNIGTKLFADENQKILEGAGSATAQGGILGAGSATIIQSPGIALTTAANTVKKGIKNTAEYVLNRGDRLLNENKSSSPISEEKVAAAINIASQTVSTVTDGIRTLASKTKAPINDTETFIERITNATQISPDEIKKLPETLRNSIPETTDRFVALAQMARIAGTETSSQEDRTSAAIFLLDQLTNQKQLFEEDIPEFLNNISHDDPNYTQFEQYKNILSAIENVPSIQEALEWAQTDMKISDITENITSQIVDNIIGISRHAPQNSNVEVNDRILAQADTGNIQLGSEKRKIIESASSLIRAGQSFNDQMTQQEQAVDPDYISNESDIISANIANNDNGSSYKYSMETHVRRINDASQRNDEKVLKERLIDLALFARHMRNKSQAHIDSFKQNGEPIVYQSLGANHEWLPESKRKPVFTKPNSAKSLALARRINAEANAVTQLANNMISIYPQFNLKPTTVPTLDPSMLIPLDQKSGIQNQDESENQKRSLEDPVSDILPTSDKEVDGSIEDNTYNPLLQTDEPTLTSLRDDESVSQPVEEDYGQSTNDPSQEVTQALSEATEAVNEPVVVTSEEIKADIQEEANIIAKKAINNINDAYPELAEVEKDGTKKGNWFKKSFKFTKISSSRLIRLENPITDLSNLLNNSESLINFLGKDIEDYDITGNHALAYKELLSSGEIIRATLKKRLNVFFGKEKDKNGKSLKDLFLEGTDVNRFERGLILNILDSTPNTFKYNTQLLETAIIAGLHWVLNNDQAATQLDRNDIANLIGIPEGDVTSQDLIDFNTGMSVDSATKSLSQMIIKFWGVDINKNVSDTYTKGIPEAVAKEIFMGLEAINLIEFSTIGRSDKTFNRIITNNLTEENKDIITAASRDGASNLLADIALIERERPSASIGTPPTEVAKKQMRSPLVNNTPQQRKSIEKAQNTPYFVNKPVFDFINAIGEDAFVNLMGGFKFNEGELNINHQRSIEGKNLTLKSAFRNVSRQMSDVDAYALKNNKDIKDIPIYYNFNVSKVGRLQMIGLSNPQSDKLAREVFMPTRSTLDMTNPVGPDAKKFWMTVGQGLGLKTEKLSRDQIQKEAFDMTLSKEGVYNKIINDLTDWLKSENSLSESIVDEIKDINPDITMHGIHSLISVAQYNKAFSENNLSNYIHYNYLEADGKTNGPINSLALFATGKFTPEWLKLVAKGGFFIGDKNKSLNTHIQTVDNTDLYKSIADIFSTKQNDLINSLDENPKAQAQFISLLKVMSAISADISFDGDNITIERGATKNPLTISIYGSGKDGIASNIANEILNIIYEELSNENNNLNEISDDFQMVINIKSYIDKETGKIVLTEPSDKDRKKRSRSEFTVTKTEFDNLKSNVRLFFVEQMSSAIDEGVLGHVDAATIAVQRATQLQSIVLTAMFNNEIIARIYDKQNNPDKYPDYRKGDALSQNELDQIYSDLMAYAPVIETGTQSFFLSGSESSSRFPTTEIAGKKITYPTSFSRTLDSKLTTPAYVYGPTLAGVSGVPSIVIGTGDGQMIQNILAKYNLTGLPVFDGFNMPASEIDESGIKVNKAVYDTWNENPLQNVANSFKEFLRNNPLDAILNEKNPLNTQKDFILKEISKVIFNERNPKETVTPEAVTEYFSIISSDLDKLSNEISTRQEVLKSFDLSIDQMASAEAPYTQEGKSLDGLSQDQIAFELNSKYDEIISNKENNESKRTVIQNENKNLIDAINTMSTEDISGVRIISQNNLNQVLDNISKGFNKTHKEMLTNTLKSLSNNEYKIIIGTSDEISNYQANTYPDNFDPTRLDYYGKIDFNNKIIYVTNVSTETLVHELIHASTLEKTINFYNNNKLLSKEDKDAFTRIEGLMHEWLLQNYSNEDAITQDAYRQATSTINGYLNNNKLPEALNEFMAWSLSNQNLIEVQKKTKVKNSLFKILEKAYVEIKHIIWGTKFAVSVDDSLFSNLRFNTRVILATPTKVEMLASDMKQIALYQSPNFGSNNYLSELRNKFTNKITSFIKNSDPLKQNIQNLKAQKAMIDGQEIANDFIAHGFPMDMQKKSTFTMIQAALMIDTELNETSFTRIQDIYAHTVKNLTVESFMNNPDINDPSDRFNAQEKFNVINGVYYTATDDSGKSSLMSSFLALALVDEDFRKILSKIEKPASLRDNSKTLDAYLTNIGNRSMDSLAVLMSGEDRKSKNVQDALDSLIENLIENVGDQRSFQEQQVINGIDAIDNYLKNQINNLSDKVISKSNEVINNTNNNKAITNTARIVRFAASIVNEQSSELAIEGLTSKMNTQERLISLRELLNEVVGRTKDNSSIFDMISKVRAAVQQTRQQFREKLPEQIQNKFTRKLSKTEWAHLYNGLGSTDVASLYGSYGVQGTLNLIKDPNKLANEISTLENNIKNIDPIRFNALQDKAKQLAYYMNTGHQGVNLLRNAYAVSHLFGDKIHQKTNGSAEGIVNTIDELISLYALDLLNQDIKDTLIDLVTSENNGVDFALSYLIGERDDELNKINSDITKVNHFKGNIPHESQLGTSLIVVNDSEHARLITLGYKRVAPYVGSSADASSINKSYYFTPVSGRATYNQGVLQTVHQTVSGIDPRTGYSTDLTAGRIDDPQRVRDITKRISQQRKTSENLMPIYDDLGNVTAYERGINPDQTIRLNRNSDLSQMIGAWRGRQMEELLAKEFNNKLIDNLNDIWNEAKKNKSTKEFIDISNSNDPIHMDSWKVIPQDIKDYIKETFGDKGFPIRRDMLNDSVGFRSASVGDVFTGNTRLKPVVQKALQKAVLGIFGNKAYSHLVSSEKFTQNLVSNAKVLIVIKSVVVPAANLFSNMFQLMNRGVPARNIIQGLGAKTVELNDYIKRRDREIVLDAELLAAKGANNNTKIRKIETELTSIKDSYKRMSIYPLIKAGEFSAISDGGITQEDLALANGKWSNWAENIATKIPDGLKTPYRYAMITRDTALFQGLTRSVQYGDFLAKSILYDDLTKRKNKSSDESLALISEEYINYNRLAGRTRNYLESSGLIWFWNFKLRSIKVAYSMIRNHPFRSLMLVNFAPSIPIIGSIGSPVTDNFFSIMNDGKLGYSIGPGMGLNSPQLNPWLALIK